MVSFSGKLTLPLVATLVMSTFSRRIVRAMPAVIDPFQRVVSEEGRPSVVVGRLVVVGLLFAVPLAYLTYEALWDPTIEFLIPSHTAGSTV